MSIILILAVLALGAYFIAKKVNKKSDGGKKDDSFFAPDKIESLFTNAVDAVKEEVNEVEVVFEKISKKAPAKKAATKKAPAKKPAAKKVKPETTKAKKAKK